MICRSNNILITGGAGFIGSNFIKYYLETHKNVNLYNLDALTYAANLENLQDLKQNPNYKFIKGNICDIDLLKDIFSQYKIDGVINFAAETHVDNSIKNPQIFINTNIIGVYNLLHVCFKFWMERPHEIKKDYSKARFHQISTDEVYGSIKSGSFDESSRYSPNSPYSASKASADMLVRSFMITYGLNCTISISSNNYGTNQHKEKFIPIIIDSIRNNKFVPIYGDGTNVRDWINVIDNCRGINLIFNESTNGEIYNIASKEEISNIELVEFLFKKFDKKKKIKFVNDRFGHDFRYSINTEKIMKEFNWKPKYDLNSFFNDHKYKF